MIVIRERFDGAATGHVGDGPKFSVLRGGADALLRKIVREEPDAAGRPIRIHRGDTYVQYPDLDAARRSMGGRA
jgi:hypothetical protein